MDGLPVVANILAILGAAAKTAEALEKLWALRDAPTELLFLMDEVCGSPKHCLFTYGFT